MSMGPTLDMIEHGGYDNALRYHLLHRHYPPPPAFMVEVARWAVEGFDGSNWNDEVPEEWAERFSYRGRTPTRGNVIEGFHLYPFIQDEEDV